MRYGNELDNHVIRKKRKGCERYRKIEEGRGGDREKREKGGGLSENWSCS